MKNTYTKLLTGAVVLGLYAGSLAIADDTAKPSNDGKAATGKHHCKTGGHCAGKSAKKKGKSTEEKPTEAAPSSEQKPQ